MTGLINEIGRGNTSQVNIKRQVTGENGRWDRGERETGEIKKKRGGVATGLMGSVGQSIGDRRNS